MQKGFVNFAFALFAALLLSGSLFAQANNNTVIALNKAPVITGVGGPTSLSAGTAGTWSVSAYDPDGNYLSYAVRWGDGLDQAQAGQSSPTSTATFQHTYYKAGTYTITFTVTDSRGAQTQSSVTTTVTAASTNHPPSFSSVSCPVTSKSVTCYIYANDPDGDPITYAVNFGDSTSQVSGMQNVFVHTYSQAGTYTVNIYATDKYGAGIGTSLQVKVTGDENQKPIITSVSGPASLSAGTAGTWSVSAYDPDGTYLSYSAVWGDEGDAPLYGSSAGSTATMQHTYSKAGTYKIVFTVKDASGATAQSTAWITVGAGSTNGLAMTAWAAPDSLSGLYMLYAKVSVDGQAPVNDNVKVTAVVNTPSGGTISNAMGPNGLNAGVYAMSFGTSMPCGTYTYKITAERQVSLKGPVSMVETSGSFALSTPYCSQASTNLPPVITGTSGPAELSVGKTGAWTVSAYDPDGISLSYSVVWGDEGTKEGAFAKNTGNSASFGHTYYKAGTYTITFTVTDSAGASVQSTHTVKVTGSASTSDVYASVGAIPSELYQYDTVYVTGKVSRGATATNDEAREYVVALMLDNGNSVSAAVETAANSQYGSIVSGQESTKTGSTVPSQGKEEHITLGPGESKEVTAYFTASQLGTNFAKVMVYEKSGSTQSGYILVASDTVKVLVKQGGIPNPPDEGITIVLQKGWNQISVPAFTLQVSDLAQKCDISENAWYYNAATKQYEKATSLGGGHVGFWVKANSDCKYTIDTPYITPAPNAFNLKAGWNMIGAPLQTTPISSFAGDCKITSGPWNYAPMASQYSYSSKLEPGKGYWVKVAAGCTLGSASDMPPSAPTDVELPAQTTTATATGTD